MLLVRAGYVATHDHATLTPEEAGVQVQFYGVVERDLLDSLLIRDFDAPALVRVDGPAAAIRDSMATRQGVVVEVRGLWRGRNVRAHYIAAVRRDPHALFDPTVLQLLQERVDLAMAVFRTRALEAFGLDPDDSDS